MSNKFDNIKNWFHILVVEMRTILRVRSRRLRSGVIQTTQVGRNDAGKLVAMRETREPDGQMNMTIRGIPDE